MKQITAFLDPTEGSGGGGNVWGSIVDNIQHCKVAVVLCTATYGRETNHFYDTRGELAQLVRRRKPMVLVKMCDRFDKEYAASALEGLEYVEWAVGAPLPDRLVASIERELKDGR
mmetsp:Transcript_24558/g.49898  ORF Transcript_24558/g.49898 Transcript_24558/m.49898 type:complete len:115 (+) Transcript_24558:228-572(+)|eukprot:CAMPEP_0196735874 /NCGR_PEP_ID=MMETSP1091-20130531/14133_1 /TAXON_ID=302021 /ORGANISM="Rhodomonas sp., Strain CCMP768" /LENGTH=114 /DNA_ID=CAMNT_0042079551 /DNA_START=42 /DNA_END=386 /DNA_ORIENTATION=-